MWKSNLYISAYSFCKIYPCSILDIHTTQTNSFLDIKTWKKIMTRKQKGKLFDAFFSMPNIQVRLIFLFPPHNEIFSQVSKLRRKKSLIFKRPMTKSRFYVLKCQFLSKNIWNLKKKPGQKVSIIPNRSMNCLFENSKKSYLVLIDRALCNNQDTNTPTTPKNRSNRSWKMKIGALMMMCNVL